MNAAPREPFDADEAAIARAYQSLPGGEPSPALDARILAQARSAVAQSRRRRRPWFLGAGMGTAAAAVMAAGIAWQLGVFSGSGHDATRPADHAPVSAPKASRALQEERIEIESFRQEAARAADAASAADAEPAPARERASAEFKERRRAAPELPPPPPPAAAAPPAPQPFPESPPAEPEVAKTEDAIAPAPVMDRSESELSRSVESDDAAAAKNAAGLGVTGSVGRLQRSDVAALPPWTDDATLAPEVWLERVRERVKRGDRAGAGFSLRQFVLSHPDRRVPRDLQRLLVE